jgi:hypothetical protein
MKARCLTLTPKPLWNNEEGSQPLMLLFRVLFLMGQIDPLQVPMPISAKSVPDFYFGYVSQPIQMK